MGAGGPAGEAPARLVGTTQHPGHRPAASYTPAGRAVSPPFAGRAGAKYTEWPAVGPAGPRSGPALTGLPVGEKEMKKRRIPAGMRWLLTQGGLQEWPMAQTEAEPKRAKQTKIRQCYFSARA